MRLLVQKLRNQLATAILWLAAVWRRISTAPLSAPNMWPTAARSVAMMFLGFLLVVLGNLETTFWENRNVDIWFKIAAYEGTTTAALSGVLVWRAIDRLSSKSNVDPFDKILFWNVLVLTVGFAAIDVVLNLIHPPPLPLPPVPKLPPYSAILTLWRMCFVLVVM